MDHYEECTPHMYPSVPATSTHPLSGGGYTFAPTPGTARQDSQFRFDDRSFLNMVGTLAVSAQPRETISILFYHNAAGCYVYIPSCFFADQLTAFEVWISRGGSALTKRGPLSLAVWTHTETQSLYLDTISESPVTAIVSDCGISQAFIASFAGGVVKVFCRRLEEEDAMVRSYSDHTSWVQKVRWHPKLSGQLLSASLNGQLKLFYLRGADLRLSMTWDFQPRACQPLMSIQFLVHSLHM